MTEYSEIVVHLPDDTDELCESCGQPADVRLQDGSTWCAPCDGSARSMGY